MAQATPPIPPADDAIPPVPVAPAVPAAPATPAPAVPATPATPAAAVPADPAAVPAPAKRKIWPFVLGGAVLLLILIIIGVSLLIGTVLNAVGGSSSPSSTVLAFDQSFKDVDCTLFTSTTTADFQASYFDEGFSCDQWEPIATGLHDDGTYNYTVVVHDTTVSGNSADVTTTEKDTTPGSEETYELDYRLLKSNGGWLIDSITNIG